MAAPFSSTNRGFLFVYSHTIYSILGLEDRFPVGEPVEREWGREGEGGQVWTGLFHVASAPRVQMPRHSGLDSFSLE
jgi:hypothetical protein